MTNYFYDAEPTDQELQALRSHHRLPQYIGLFTSPYEFHTFTELREAYEARMKAEREAAIVVEVDNTPVRIVEGAGVEEDEVDEADVDCQEGEGGEVNEVSKDSHADGGNKDAFFCADEDDDLPDPPELARLYMPEKLVNMESNIEATCRDESTRKQLKKLFATMRVRGCERKLAQLPAKWIDMFDALAARYPNFISVIQHIRIECQLAELSWPRVVRLPPMLLCGPPGIGKTVFAMDFANIFGGGFFNVSMENAQHGSALCGSSNHWSNSKTGLVFDALVNHHSINPVILVDEIDKASTDTRNNPLAPLYQLLEAKQAAEFRDLSIPDLPIDASRITWIFTANELALVPEPIVNRMRVYHIAPPTMEQGRKIVATLFSEEIESIGRSIFDNSAYRRLLGFEITQDIISLLTTVSVRQAKIFVRRAIANALANESDKLHVSDLIDLTELHIEKGASGAH